MDCICPPFGANLCTGKRKFSAEMRSGKLWRAMKHSNIPVSQNPLHNRIIILWWIFMWQKNQSFELCRASLAWFTVFKRRSVSLTGYVNSLVLQKEFSVDNTARTVKQWESFGTATISVSVHFSDQLGTLSLCFSILYKTPWLVTSNHLLPYSSHVGLCKKLTVCSASL